ncbi:hypothetical protein MVES_002260 [Malassezia vespertilionis]|uniref:PX domain-containing protein n=1 Tax=Malassezia vespertilionis TaxID=2020962 RepID=A0A2N1JBH1_9BASI|nr:hypothetical protein MVES_002260 [Malassezia vespertilionis]
MDSHAAEKGKAKAAPARTSAFARDAKLEVLRNKPAEPHGTVELRSSSALLDSHEEPLDAHSPSPFAARHEARHRIHDALSHAFEHRSYFKKHSPVQCRTVHHGYVHTPPAFFNDFFNDANVKAEHIGPFQKRHRQAQQEPFTPQRDIAARKSAPVTPDDLEEHACDAIDAPADQRVHDPCFAQDVRIRGWHRVGSPTRGWVVYDVNITTKSGLELQTHKRYSDFVGLHGALAQQVPEHASALPRLPPRHTGLWQRHRV